METQDDLIPDRTNIKISKFYGRKELSAEHRDILIITAGNYNPFADHYESYYILDLDKVNHMKLSFVDGRIIIECC